MTQFVAVKRGYDPVTGTGQWRAVKLAQVSRYFDRTLVTDPVTGGFLFKAQFSNYDDSKRDAFTAYRRIMSLSPEITSPARARDSAPWARLDRGRRPPGRLERPAPTQVRNPQGSRPSNDLVTGRLHGRPRAARDIRRPAVGG